MKNIMKKMIESKKNIPCLFYPAAKDIGYTIEEVLKNAEKQAELLCHIDKTYDVGAVIRMTELWCEGASFGVDVTISNNSFPKLGEPICEDPEDLEEICISDAVNEITEPLIDAVKIAVPNMEKPLIVGVTGPYTLGTVINGTEDFMCNCMMDDELVKEFLNKVTDYLIAYILEYKKAGAAGVIMAEPATAMVSPDMMEEFSNYFIEKIIHAVSDDDFMFIYHNCGAVNQHLNTIKDLPADGFHFGSDVNINEVLNTFSKDVLIMGNIEPQMFLSGKQENIETAMDTLRNECSDYGNFILSTGCDLSPNAKVEIFET